MKVIHLDDIKACLDNVDLLPPIEKAFTAYSQGLAVVPPIGELLFNSPPGEVHIKYGYIQHDDCYIIKVASGFYDNPKLNLPSSNGLMLLFSQKTGELRTILLDEGYLTALRTAAAGTIAAKYLMPSHVRKIGIVGTGTQAKLQLQQLRSVTDCRQVMVYGRHADKLQQYLADMKDEGFDLASTQNIEDITQSCNLIVTTTPSTTPLLLAHQIQPGTHITAVGSDTPHKQELDAALLAKADVVVADSVAQCLERGDSSHAIRSGVIGQDKLIELGNIISGAATGRSNDDAITIADLTGLAVQDVQIAKLVLQHTSV